MLIGYIDPSVMTYAIQIGAGVVIALGAFIGIKFRKAKKKVNEKLGIDENKNKEVESDDIFEEVEEPKKEEKKETSKPKTSSNKKSSKKSTKSKK